MEPMGILGRGVCMNPEAQGKNPLTETQTWNLCRSRSFGDAGLESTAGVVRLQFHTKGQGLGFKVKLHITNICEPHHAIRFHHTK